MHRTGHFCGSDDRSNAAELDPKAKQGDLLAALEPVVDRLLKRYETYKTALGAAYRFLGKQTGRYTGSVRRTDIPQTEGNMVGPRQLSVGLGGSTVESIRREATPAVQS